MQGHCRAASEPTEVGWAGFAGPGPGARPLPRSERSERSRVGRLCRTGTRCKATAAQRAKRPKSGGPALPDRDPVQGHCRAASEATEVGWAGFAGPGPGARPLPRSERSDRSRVGRLCRTGTRCKATAAQRAKRPKSGGPALPDRDPVQGHCRAASEATEVGWAGFAGPGPGARPLPRSERSDRSRVGRLCRTGTRCKAAAQRAKRAKSGGPALPDRDPVQGHCRAASEASEVGWAGFAGPGPAVRLPSAAVSDTYPSRVQLV